MDTNSKKLIVVLGMHRSGTSVITRGLQVMGVELGDSMMPPIENNNPTGFWEDVDINALNIEMLNAISSDWCRLAQIEPGDVEILRIKGYFLRAVELLRQKTSSMPVFGFKDPRVAKLLPFWKEVFSHCQFDVNYVLTVRHPLSVAKSLSKRDGIEIEQGYLLWLGHVITSMAVSEGDVRVVIDYDRFMEFPDRELRRIARSTSLEIDLAELKYFKNEFLDQGLRHTHYDQKDLLLDDRCPPIVRDAYTTVLKAASGRIKLDSVGLKNKVARWVEELNRIKSSLLLVDKLYTQNMIAAQTLVERDGQIDELNFELSERDEKIAVFNATSTERDSQIAGLNVAVKEREGQIAALIEAISERDSQIKVINETLLERDSQLIGLNEALSEPDGQIAGLNKLISERDTLLTNLNESLSERDSQLNMLNDMISDLDRQNSALNDAISERDDLIVEVNLHLTAVRDQLNDVLASKSWKLTEPLRFLRRILLTRPSDFIRQVIPKIPRYVWRHLPFSSKSKLKLKHALFKGLPTFLGWTQPYRAWATFEQQEAAAKDAVTNNKSRVYNIDGKQELQNPVPLLDAKPLEDPSVRLIAFYLPQFHPIPENNEWWGEGFTEWTNVRPAQPQFVGHYQPHVPGELGYYDLRDNATQKRQIELAKLYGISGFCFYFYWFGGKRLLETPLINYLNEPSFDLPFCLCWANENWSRRWDGLDSEILISQEHSHEDDLLFIKHVAHYMRDPRYIRIEGKPLLLVYRPGLLPKAKDTARRWRKWCIENQIGEIYLAYTQSFEAVNPEKYGFDAAIEFPPNNSSPPDITNSVSPLSNGFGSTVYDWRVLVERSENYIQPDYKLFRSVCPSWDNTARRKNSSTVFLNSTPPLYQYWLENAISNAEQAHAKPDERLVFINAWNEWAEGAYLEPDEKYGYAYLQSTRNALERAAKNTEKRRILLVAHDGYMHGAQYLILNMAKVMRESMGFNVDMIVLGEGPLIEEYRKYAKVHELSGCDPQSEKVIALVAELFKQGVVSAIVNTTVSGLIVPVLKQHGFTVVSLVHELPQLIKDYDLHEHVKAIAANADKIVFAATPVLAGFESIVEMDKEKVIIRPQGLYKKNLLQSPEQLEEAHTALRKKFNLPKKSKIILGVGYADYRKGIDIFVEAGLEVLKQHRDVYFIWLGNFESRIEKEINKNIEKSGFNGHFLFPGLDYDSDIYYAGADIYALTSREDPFPSVMLEAMDALTPVVAFSKSGGSHELLAKGCGILVDEMTSKAFSSSLVKLIDNPEKLHRLALKGKKIIDEDYSFRKYLFDLAVLANTGLRRISVVVPNYNYEQYIEARLQTIFEQNYPIYEVIILDDASSDSSVDLIKDKIKKQNTDSKLIVNTANSGSVFKQWANGVEISTGDYIWIAEADDLSAPEFLEEVIKGFDESDTVISYCESKQIDSRRKCYFVITILIMSVTSLVING